MRGYLGEGSFDPDFVTMDAKLLDARVTGNQLGSFILNTGSGIGKFMGLMKGKDPNFKLIAAPYPGLKAGDKPKLGQKDFAFTGVGAAITTANKRVTETVKWLDFAYSPEGHMLMNFGLEGLSYTMVNGYPKYTDVVTKNPDGLPLGQAMGRHFRSCFHGPFVQDKRYMEQYAALPEQQESLAIWTQPGNEMLMPPVTPTQEESSRFASVMNDVNTRFEEAFVKVLAGDEPLESWDTVVQQLKQMGIEDAIKIQQAALDRYGKR